MNDLAHATDHELGELLAATRAAAAATPPPRICCEADRQRLIAELARRPYALPDHEVEVPKVAPGDVVGERVALLALLHNRAVRRAKDGVE
jgi:hypothetical protein